MNGGDAAFLEALRATFKIEAAEHSHSIATGLLGLERSPTPEAQHGLIATVFRAAHSLKGAARAVDLTEVEFSCQVLEDLFAGWKEQQGRPAAAGLDTAHRALDSITEALGGGHPAAASPSPLHEPAAALVVVASSPVAAPEDTVRITIAKLDARLMEAEEMLTAKLTTAQRAKDLRELGQRFHVWQEEWAVVEPVARALGQVVGGRTVTTDDPGLGRLLEFVEWNRDHMRSLEAGVAALARTAQQDHHAIGKLVDDLLEDSKKLLLLPFATLAAPFPKMVRDLCRDLGKEADLVVRGEEVEIDKRILEEMKDPLIHLLRNCVDHGVEPADARARAGKPRRATIVVEVRQVDGNKVQISVSDDGAGIDVGKVKRSAVRHGLLSESDAAARDDTAARDLIFHADVSTSPMITRLSGRGIGMAIVREQAEKLGGTVTVSSQPGEGTRFCIVLPLMLATFRGVLIEVAGGLFVVPTAHVERVVRVKVDEVQTVEGRETIALGGRAVSLVRLADVLALPDAGAATPVHWTILVLGLGEQRIAFVVDAVLGEQEVLVKRLRLPLSRVRNIAGATVLGSGRVAPILNVVDLLKSARKAGVAVVGGARHAPAAPSTKSVLAADDSATSRMLIKSMLESAGYRVTSAVDGLEAFTMLRAGMFDLLVSDVEMPRMNGFELTARIRADDRLSELPVVLVTGMETREDREHGIDVGANAYIVKSSLDQGNLLDAVRRLA